MFCTTPRRYSATELELIEQRADEARSSPYWPFAPLTEHQQRQRAAQERAMRAAAVSTAPRALW